MKRCLLVCAVLFMAIFLAVKGFSATYDLTGEWDWTDYDHWDNCGGDPEPDEQGTDIIIQNGNNFTVITSDRTITGNVSGNVYSVSETWWEEGGWVTVNFAMTASSSTQYSGTSSWTWTGNGESCSGGNKVSATRRAQHPPTYDATGKWDYSESGFWNNCGDPNPQPRSGTDTLTQTGNRITVVDDQQRSFYGFVSGSTYTFVRSYPEEGGTTSEVYTVILSSGGTSGSGISKWVWNDAYESCNGGWNFSYARQQEE